MQTYVLYLKQGFYGFSVRHCPTPQLPSRRPRCAEHSFDHRHLYSLESYTHRFHISLVVYINLCKKFETLNTIRNKLLVPSLFHALRRLWLRLEKSPGVIKCVNDADFCVAPAFSSELCGYGQELDSASLEKECKSIFLNTMIHCVTNRVTFF
jgi:hypothetical protein